MTLTIARTAIVSMAGAALLTLSLVAASSAQVASLADPTESPVPETETAATELEFADREEALLAFAQCMRDNDIDMDDPVAGAAGRGFFGGGPGAGPGSGGFDQRSEEFQSAQANCGSILEASRPDLDPAAVAERLEEDLAMAQCLRDQGYEDYPDPVVDADGRRQRFGGRDPQELGFDPRSEEFQLARAACADELGVEFGPGARAFRGGD